MIENKFLFRQQKQREIPFFHNFPSSHLFVSKNFRKKFRQQTHTQLISRRSMEYLWVFIRVSCVLTDIPLNH